jgi:hypothetical protein
MASLVSDIIADALFYINAYGPGQTVSTDDQTFGLRVVNRVLDGWSARKLSPIGIKQGTYALSGAGSYTYGPAMVWAATVRPIKVKAAATVAANGVQKEARVVTAEQWAGMADLTRTGIYIEDLYWDGGWPTGIVYVTPKPTAGSCLLWTYEQITAFVNLTDAVALPLGYERALVIAFALELCLPFGRPIPEGLPQLAQQAMVDIAALSAEILGTAVPAASPQGPGAGGRGPGL